MTKREKVTYQEIGQLTPQRLHGDLPKREIISTINNPYHLKENTKVLQFPKTIMIKPTQRYMNHKAYLRREFPMTSTSPNGFPFKYVYNQYEKTNETKPPYYKANESGYGKLLCAI